MIPKMWRGVMLFAGGCSCLRGAGSNSGRHQCASPGSGAAVRDAGDRGQFGRGGEWDEFLISTPDGVDHGIIYRPRWYRFNDTEFRRYWQHASRHCRKQDVYRAARDHHERKSRIVGKRGRYGDQRHGQQQRRVVADEASEVQRPRGFRWPDSASRSARPSPCRRSARTSNRLSPASPRPSGH